LALVRGERGNGEGESGEDRKVGFTDRRGHKIESCGDFPLELRANFAPPFFAVGTANGVWRLQFVGPY
jgi:hypothetical protein